ncbi:type VI secretion system protein TssA [Microbacteriaceae bacterium K1510]|nr:type VI secretion system protein TssA [Microbacteriaceae bacterium K1510]
MSEFVDARALYGAAPVDGDAPAGIDVRGDAEFEQLEAEVRRMDADGPAAVDWRKVNSLALNILSSRAKDILVASWTTYGLFRTEGYPGLAVGLGILRGMVESHWDGLFPPVKRERARVGAIDWLVGRLTPVVVESAPSDAEQPAVIAAYDAVGDLDRLLGEKLVKEQAALGELFRALRPYHDEAKRAIAAAAEAARAAEEAASAAQATPAAEPSVSPAQAASAPAAAVQAPAADGDWLGFADRLPDMLRQTSAALRVASAQNPRAYLLNRLGSWLRFDALPADTGGRTMVFPPADAIAALEAKVAAGQHADVVALAEELAWTGPFWLDAHRHAFTALEQLGAAFQPAAFAVRAAMAMLVTRYPKILELAFNDGRPFADDETRAWAAVGSGSSAPARNPANTAVSEAHKHLASGQVQSAFDTLTGLLRSEGAGRGRFVGQLAQARFCMDTGFVTTAVPLLEHLDDLAVERDLESWEPDLALDVAELRYRALVHSDANQLIDEARRRTALEQIRSRVARIDIGRASQLGRR